MTHGPNKTKYPCGDPFDMATNAGNSDANCHRLRQSYSKLLISREPKTCDGCVYRFDYLPF